MIACHCSKAWVNESRNTQQAEACVCCRAELDSEFRFTERGNVELDTYVQASDASGVPSSQTICMQADSMHHCIYVPVGEAYLELQQSRFTGTHVAALDIESTAVDAATSALCKGCH